MNAQTLSAANKLNALSTSALLPIEISNGEEAISNANGYAIALPKNLLEKEKATNMNRI
tara:strand:+ start:62 stop:238 length:177 start_codon:yes stop_codon:yes gene_type:complete